jgi:DNA polymerase-3 subunit delta'
VDRELAALEKSRKSTPLAVEIARRLFGAGTSRAWYRKSLGIEMINGKGDGSYFRTVESLLSRSAGEGWRAAVLDDADRMTDPAENAFLKTLEEPPPRTLLILVTSQPLSLLPTTLSRCARVVFDAVPPEELTRFLVETQDVEEADATVLTALAEGSPGRALELRGIDFATRLRFLEELLPAVAAGDLQRCLALGGGRVTAPAADAAGVRDAQRREARLLLELLALAFRDLAISGVVPGVRLVSGLPARGVAELAALQPPPVWEALFERAELALSDVNAAVEPRLAVETLFTDALPLGRVA